MLSYEFGQLLDTRVLVNLEDQSKVSAVERETLLLDHFSLVLKLTLDVLESKDLGVLNWQHLVWIPVTVLKRLDASILLESESSLFERSVHFIRKVHVLLVSSGHIGMLDVLLRDLVLVFLEVFILVVIVFLC